MHIEHLGMIIGSCGVLMALYYWFVERRDAPLAVFALFLTGAAIIILFATIAQVPGIPNILQRNGIIMLGLLLFALLEYFIWRDIMRAGE